MNQVRSRDIQHPIFWIDALGDSGNIDGTLGIEQLPALLNRCGIRKVHSSLGEGIAQHDVAGSLQRGGEIGINFF